MQFVVFLCCVVSSVLSAIQFEGNIVHLSCAVCLVHAMQFVGNIVQFSSAVWSVPYNMWVTVYNFPMLYGQCRVVCG